MEYTEISIRITLPPKISVIIKKEKMRFVPEVGSSYNSEPHITLYLARYTEDGFSKLIMNLKELIFNSFTFSLLGLKVNLEGYRNLYVVEVSDQDKLQELRDKICSVASRYQSPLLREKDQKRFEQGIVKDSWPWFPHITLGEVPIDAPQPDLADVRKNIASIEGEQITVFGVTLFLYGKEEGVEKMKLINEVKIDF